MNIFAGKSLAVGDSKKEAASLCTADCVLLLPLKALRQECDKHPATSLN